MSKGDKVTLTTKLQALRRAQARLGGPLPAGTKMVSEELIEDRAVAARQESGDERWRGSGPKSPRTWASR